MGKIRHHWIAGAGFAAAALLAGCNIFEPFTPKRASTLDYRGLIIRGNDALNHQRYAEAESLYIMAQRKNPRGSEAYLFHAQAVVARYKLNFTLLQLEFDCKRDSARAQKPELSKRCRDNKIDTTGVPFIHPTTQYFNIDSVFYPVAIAVQDLNHILRGSSAPLDLGGGYTLPPDGDTASDGRVSPGVARLDLGLLQAIVGMLAPLDLDHNLHVDNACGKGVVASVDSLKSLCKVGPYDVADSGEVFRLRNFVKLTQGIHLDNLDSKDVKARNMSTNPQDINSFIASMQVPIAGSIYNLDSVESAMNSHNATQLASEISGAVNNVRDLNNFLSYMKYNDAIDDDYDHQGVATPVTFLWHNFDRDDEPTGAYKDHGIRYDYDDGTNFGILPLGAGNIGNLFHRHVHPSLYLRFSEWGDAQHYPHLARDSSKNSRMALMRKKCRDALTNSLTNAFAFANQAALLTTCDSITAVLRETTPRPTHSDWVGGTPGVDEEMIDEFDNDYDGIKDEDARNLKSYDDDDDALLKTCMVFGNCPATVPPTPGSPVAMQWADVAGHSNLCPDIDTALGMYRTALRTDPSDSAIVNYHLRRQNCIGSLENRLYFARTNPDSLKVYYSEYIDSSSADPYVPNTNCTDDYSKLDRAFVIHWEAGAGPAGAAQEMKIACHAKHIWVAPRPANSEWTGGVFGIDEEKFDGVDNDGDGWIDEDINVQIKN